VPSSRWITHLLILGMAVLQSRIAAAQGWRPSARIEAEVRRDGNPFLLTQGQRDRLAAPSFADSVSGRVRDMASASDVIPVVAADASLTGRGLGRRDLQISTAVAYEANLHNARRRHAELELTVEQSLPQAGRVRLGADWRPSYFWKNYLNDAIDVSGDGNITPDERIYRAGTSHEVDLTLNLRRRLVKARKTQPVELLGEVEVGYFVRGYDAPFAGRDRRGPGAGVGLTAQLGARWTAGLEYAFESLKSDVVREVLILDETEFGVDFNGTNGAGDVDARAFELIDRSRVAHDLQVSVETELSSTVTLGVAYGRRMRVYTSTQPFDVADRDRRDTRNQLEAELRVRLVHGLRLTVGASTARQTTNRAGDPGSSGEVADYSRSVLAAGLAYRF
jgi:hypothetical protein